MPNYEVKYQHLNRNRLNKLPRIMLVLLFALAACQKPPPPITASVPNTGVVLTFIPSDGGVRAIELAIDQEDRMIKKINVGDVVNTFAMVNDKKLDPANAALCADAIVKNNPANLQPEPVGSGKPSSAIGVLLPEGVLIIPVKPCGDLKTNSTSTASSVPTKTQTPVPMATPQTQGTETPVNNKIDMGVALGTLCASILGIGVMFGGFRALVGRKEKKHDTQLVLTRINTEEVPTVIPLQGNDNIPDMAMIDGKLQPILQDHVVMVIGTDRKTVDKAKALLVQRLKDQGAPANRAELAQLSDHEAKHIINAPEGVSIVQIVKKPTGEIIGASVRPIKPNPTADEIRTIAQAPGEDKMSEQDRYIYDHADEFEKRFAKKKK